MRIIYSPYIVLLVKKKFIFVILHKTKTFNNGITVLLITIIIYDTYVLTKALNK